MKYKELAAEISRMTPEQKENDVMIWIHGMENYYIAESLQFTDEAESGLDKNYPYLTV